MTPPRAKEIEPLPGDPFPPLELERREWQGWFPAMIIAIIAGLIGGAGAFIALRTYLWPVTAVTPIIQAPSNFTKPSSFKIPVLPEEEAIRKTKKTLVYVYKKSKPDSILASADLAGLGVSLTSDGWIALPQNNIKEFSSDAFVVIANDSPSTVETVIADPFTHLIFLKLRRDDLQVVPFASADTMAIGESLTAWTPNGALKFKKFTGISRAASEPISSESLDRFISTDPESENGSILFNGKGELAGIANQKGKAVPPEVLQNTAQLAIKKRTMSHPKLGVTFVDLGLMKDPTKKLPKEGALLVRSKTSPAVAKKSSAEKAGLLEGDVIVKFDAIDIGPDNTLGYTLSLYSPGVEVPLKIWRKGSTKDLTIILQ